MVFRHAICAVLVTIAASRVRDHLTWQRAGGTGSDIAQEEESDSTPTAESGLLAARQEEAVRSASLAEKDGDGYQTDAENA